MGPQYACRNERRREAVLRHASLNGIDYLEVLDQEAPAGSPRQRTLLLRCLKALPAELGAANAHIAGGVRIAPVGVEWARPATGVGELLAEGLINQAEHDFLAALPEPERLLLVRTNAAGDFSTYRLCLVQSPLSDTPREDFDPLLACVDFSFKADCPGVFDCRVEPTYPPERLPEPQIDYLAKDYTSFRRLLLDRLAQTLPDWQERNPSDLGIVLVELLAYAADQLSYYQDAVATEAYLGTARKRVSLRRHARLLDYRVHDGCNARAWVHLRVDGDLAAPGTDTPLLAAGTPLLTRVAGQAVRIAPDSTSHTQALDAGPVVFETMHAVQALFVDQNEMRFYTWGAQECCLPKGATRATLHGHIGSLQVGDVLVLEEVLGVATGQPADADPAQRHAVRLTDVRLAADPLGGQFLAEPVDDSVPITEIAWADGDALPFPLCLSTLMAGELVGDISVARGNIVLVDHGRTIRAEPLDDEALVATAPRSGQPALREADLTHHAPYDQLAQSRAASVLLTQAPREALPAVSLRNADDAWTVKPDLLGSDRFAHHFVVEMDETQRAQLRFGDGVLGQRPTGGLLATYRVGNGAAGNVGAGTIAHIVTAETGIVGISNPFPAQGGVDPEPLEQVRLYAPEAFRTQERSVTEEDHARAAERHPEVQKAAATRRWTGSWHTVFVTIDRKGGRPIDVAFETELRGFLEQFRLAGHDLEIDAPRFVPLDIALAVCVAPGYFHDAVHSALLEVFSAVDLPDGRRGFFHPDNYTFGQAVYLSQLVATALRVPGVRLIDVAGTAAPGPLFALRRPRTRFQRWGQSPRGELAAGRIALERLEIARLDNDPNAPENGRIEFLLEGGQ